MSHRPLLSLAMLATLSFGAAVAQTTPPPAPTAITLPGQLPAELVRLWATFVTSGGIAELLDADGDVIGVVNEDGTVTLEGEATLSDVKAVSITPPEGEATVINLTRDLAKPGAIKVEWMGPNGKTQSLPLQAVLNRVAKGREAAPAPTPTEPDPVTEAPAPTDPVAPTASQGKKAESPAGERGKSAEKSQKPAQNPGQGKGKR